MFRKYNNSLSISSKLSRIAKNLVFDKFTISQGNSTRNKKFVSCFEIRRKVEQEIAMWPSTAEAPQSAQALRQPQDRAIATLAVSY